MFNLKTLFAQGKDDPGRFLLARRGFPLLYFEILPSDGAAKHAGADKCRAYSQNWRGISPPSSPQAATHCVEVD
ncbi:hypothetical protein [Janthinobacterium sp.]|uniref:hypothetical protein n=1 Tax=Janthinobacterium sp. TaxID=1871054 RepID=UPI00293D39CF|nr:hypothetical protein [Janthinobacterium sp.]